MQLLLRNYLLSINEGSGEDAFAAFCKLHLQLSVRCTLYVAIRATKNRNTYFGGAGYLWYFIYDAAFCC